MRFYQCSQCREPFDADNELAIDARAGRCPRCYAKHTLREWGLGDDFLTRNPFGG